MAARIHVTANAGDFLGAALPGDPAGMAEGTVLVGGDAGDRVGDRMRRGLIAVHGRVGDIAASRMIGGTIVALRGCGADPGYAMRRGSLLLGHAPPNLLATFADNGTHELPWLRLLARQLRAAGAAAGAAELPRRALDRLRLGRRQGRDSRRGLIGSVGGGICSLLHYIRVLR